VRERLVAREGSARPPDLIAQLLDEADHHAGIVQVLTTLERHAVDGRVLQP
jgi:hypothetical protein